MDSLTTSYLVCMLIGSASAVGGAMAGNKFAPIESSNMAEVYTTPSAPKILAVDAVEESKPSITDIQKSKLTVEEDPSGANVILYNPDQDEHDKIVYNETLPPREFFEEQQQFLKNLSNDEKLVLKSYTEEGYALANPIMRNIEISKKYILGIISELKNNKILFGLDNITEDNANQAANTYISKLKQIFDKAPMVRTAFKVIRGTKENITDLKGFTSTSYNAMSGSVYDAFSGKDCCIYELTIQPGVKLIWVNMISVKPNETEILISPNVSMSITKETRKEIWNIKSYVSKDFEKLTKTVYEGTINAA